ncbi:MAG: hypothetical protein V7K26_00210 [Nostoc sp.]|uniref:hypothetical protein n=1 Tax=Nostoc sp. TaxID=1180 RepID=UPI002FF2AE5A
MTRYVNTAFRPPHAVVSYSDRHTFSFQVGTHLSPNLQLEAYIYMYASRANLFVDDFLEK